MSLRKTWRPGDAFLVLYKDADVVVVDKKAGVLTVGRPSGRGVSLMQRLEELLGPRSTVIPVHRLDRPVSGVLVVARHAAAEKVLRQQFAAHDVERRYYAGVTGVIAEELGTFESKLATSGRALRMHSSEDGKDAVTHWRVVERYPAANATLVEVMLETGLRNQIRVHFSEAGHPLLGERKYLDEDDPDASSSQGTHRIFLHAASLGFVHPRTGKALRFEAPVPPDLMAWRRALERGPARGRSGGGGGSSSGARSTPRFSARGPGGRTPTGRGRAGPGSGPRAPRGERPSR